jgi:hypothetical protein
LILHFFLHVNCRRKVLVHQAGKPYEPPIVIEAAGDRAKVAVSTGRIDYKAVHSDWALERSLDTVSVAEKQRVFR